VPLTTSPHLVPPTEQSGAHGKAADPATKHALDVSPVLPDYDGRCVTRLVPGLLSSAIPEWFPAELVAARQVVLLVVDGLGWHQLQDRATQVPDMMALAGEPLTTVAPTTTATALTSIATGTSPSEHGLVGYRIWVEGEAMNVLRWRSGRGDMRQAAPPTSTQPIPAFLGRNATVVHQHQFVGSPFSEAHLAGARFRSTHAMSSIAIEVGAALAAGDRFVYAYHDGIDQVAHGAGVEGPQYDAELAAVDRLISDIRTSMGPDAALVVTADHGLVQVGDAHRVLDPALVKLTRGHSGEARFMWLHSRPGRLPDLVEAAEETCGDDAWVVTAEQVIDQGWFGGPVEDTIRARLGDVAIVAREKVAYMVEAQGRGFHMIGRHGSMTSEEAMVPFLVAHG